jgi:hypothetical protein
MDLKQRKLTKSEWDSIEIPVSKSELEVLSLITNGFGNVNIRINKTDSIFTYLKIEYSAQIEEFLYAKFFADKVQSLVTTYSIPFIQFKRAAKSDGTSVTNPIVDGICYINVSTLVRLKSGDQIRMSRVDGENMGDLYEFVLYANLEQMVKNKAANCLNWMFYYYTLYHLLQNSVEKVNRFIKNICQCFLIHYESDLQMLHILENSVQYIEKNRDLLKYSDLSLYEHQKTIYTAVKQPRAKLILYIAPTGTGKTLTPLGLSEGNKVIFVCAARHVGLALARAAISINKKIAFAFGCSSAEDVRLHYFAAKDYTTDKRSGQIRKVDNTVGDKVEIIICDIRSYVAAMYYMLAFNKAKDIITYWDEPTITMDYADHELHGVIKRNWKENIIPNVVLSSATLPKVHELTLTIADFQAKFPNANIHNIVSHDCRKTIPLINNNGYVVMPHYLYSEYQKILEVAAHCEENQTLLRYFDLKEASDFICYVEKHGLCKNTAKVSRNFASVSDVNMKMIKQHYIKVLKNIAPDKWSQLYNYFNIVKTRRIQYNMRENTISKTTSCETRVGGAGEGISRVKSVELVSGRDAQGPPPGSSGVFVTTKDAYTLTDGPTIFLANDLQKIAKFCIQQANIPASVMKDIMDKIDYNNQINERIEDLEKQLELEEEKLTAKLSGSNTDNSKEAKGLKSKKDNKGKAKIANSLVGKSEDKAVVKMREDINTLKSMVKRATMDDLFVPNKLAHLKKWAEHMATGNAFTSNIDEEYMVQIMLLKDVDDSWKVLLLLGIGVFTDHKSSAYTEIMKKLADQQKLYLVIADSDYIYGTNYQFCHGYLSKDLLLTQEKIIQALGRIGRNNIQQEYSARFRDDSQISVLFTRVADKPEVINMNQLFNSRNVKWNGEDYVEQFEEGRADVYEFADDNDSESECEYECEYES